MRIDSACVRLSRAPAAGNAVDSPNEFVGVDSRSKSTSRESSPSLAAWSGAELAYCQVDLAGVDTGR